MLSTRLADPFEPLNSSLAQSAAELWLAKVCPERVNYAFSEKFWIRPKTGFLTHNFGYRYAGMSIQSSIDADFHLVFNKTLSQKNGSMRWGLGPAKILSPLWCHLQKSSHRNGKLFFSILIRRLVESVEGLNSSLALAAGDLWPKNCKPIYWLTRSLKG